MGCGCNRPRDPLQKGIVITMEEHLQHHVRQAPDRPAETVIGEVVYREDLLDDGQRDLLEGSW